MRIVGVDPGKTTGVAVLNVDNAGWTLISRYQVEPEGETRGEQLYLLFERLTKEMAAKGTVVAMEEMLAYRQNSADEKVESQAATRLAAYASKVELETYAPATVRSVVCRDGRADPRTIRETVRFLARTPKRSRKGEGWSPHQIDALAVALCHMERSGYVLDRCKEVEE